jgi:UDP-N-acetyl-D-galactosamine dehydrogenase
MTTVAVIGLGYVGLPLVVEFGKHGPTIGFDIAESKVESCKNGIDPAHELSEQDMASAVFAEYSSDPSVLAEADVIIIAVPTPVDNAHIPDFTPLIGASRCAGQYMKKNAVVIYESTVYPGATEEVCIPVLEQASKMKWKKDFFVGYSPERINPGDREHTLTKILKVVSGDTPETLEKVATLYEKIVIPGVHRCSSIKAAEACKVIENTQRDLNIALMNELAIIFEMLDIDTNEVFEAAGTKWNFLNFKPGLVGGHCIGVDPYYLAQKAQEVGYHPEIILAGRRLNDSMGKHVATEVVKLMMRKDLKVIDSKVLILGFTFKEDCPDVRNTRVIDIFQELRNFDVNVEVFDPWANAEDVMLQNGIVISNLLPSDKYSAVIVAVAHKVFKSIDIRSLTPKGVIFDLKGILPKESTDARL